MNKSGAHDDRVDSYNVSEVKTRLSEILQRVSEGEKVVLTSRGQPIARVVPIPRKKSILGAGKQDPNINHEVVARDEWWRPMPGDETRDWYK
jgi:prevent-host-death family protein